MYGWIDGWRQGGMAPLCIAMCRNVLLDMWRTSFYLLSIMEWVHIAWIGCMLGNPSEAGYPASIFNLPML